MIYNYFGVVISLKLRGKGVRFTFNVVQNHHRLLLGVSASEYFLFVNRVENVLPNAANDIAAFFPEHLQRLGCGNHKYQIVLKPGSQPVIEAARHVHHLL